MTTLCQRLQDPGYKAWIKAGLCLSLAKEGLKDFADDRSQQFHQSVLTTLKNNGNPSCNGICKYATIYRGNVSCCHNCQAFVDEIDRQNQRSFKFLQHNWDNSDMKRWPNDPWEMAKVFMNKGQTPTQRSPVDTDLSGILNFIDHCVVAKRCIVNTHNIGKVRKARNDVMHSASMSLSQKELSDFTGDIVGLLEDPGTLCQSESAKEALKEIRKVVVHDFNISLDNEIKVIKERTETVEQRIRILEATVQGQFDSLKSKGERDVVRLQKEIGILQKTKHELNEEVQMLKERIGTYSDIKEEIHMQMKDLNVSLEGIGSVILANTNTIANMEERVAALETDHDLLTERQTALEQRERHIEDQLLELRETSVKTDISTAAKRLQETLIEEYKHIGFEVPLSPIYDGLNDDLLKVNIDELYTDLVIEVRDGKEEVPLISYKNIFRMNGRTNRTIFLKGEAGVGKSTWCSRLLHAWVKTHDKVLDKSGDHTDSNRSTSSNVQARGIEEAISQFDFLFFVPLRYVTGKTSIKDVIFSAFPERFSSMKDTVSTIIEQCSDKVLVLLDGIDEYIHDLSYEGLNQCTVITTTRPWKYDIICASNRRLKIDMILNLKGLDDAGIGDLTERVHTAIHKHESSDMSLPQSEKAKFSLYDFEKEVRNCGLTDTLKIPLMLISLLETYLERGSLSLSMTKNLVHLIEVLIQRGKQKMSPLDMQSRSQENTTAVFSDNETLSDYGSVLQKLAKLAFGGLFKSKEEEALLFSENQLCKIFSKDELHLCLKFGLLSRSCVFTSLLLERKSSLSFYHKLLQEFFAAAWIVSSVDACEEFRKTITSRSAIFEFENVFIFICGMDAHIGSELSKHLVHVCTNCSIPRQSGVCRNELEADMLTGLMTMAQKEVDFGEKPHESLYVLDIFTLDIHMFRPSISCFPKSLTNLMQASIKYLRIIHLDPSYFVSHYDKRNLIGIISKSQELQRVDLNMFNHFGSVERKCRLEDENLQLLSIDFSRHTKLQTVILNIRYNDCKLCRSLYLWLLAALQSLPHLKHLDLHGSFKIGDILLEFIPSLTSLTSLTLHNFTILDGDLIVSSKELRNLEIKDVKIDEFSFVLNPNSCKLENVKVDGVRMKASSWSDLVKLLSKQDELINVELNNKGTIVKTEKCLDLSTNRQLQALSISSLELSALNVCIETELRQLRLRSVKMSESAWCHLFATLRSKTLKTIELRELDIGSAEIDLSQATQLQDVVIDDVKLCVEDSTGQRVSDETNMEPIGNTGWERILNVLPTKTLHQLALYNVDIGTAIIRIDENSCLRLIFVKNVSMSKKAFETLRSCLKSLTNLPYVEIENVHVEGDIINDIKM